MSRNHPAVRVLIVDDDERQRVPLGQIVEAMGFTAILAGDGEEALECHAANPAAVIVTDLVMPRMGGMELLKELEVRGDRTPTIVLTGFGNIEKAISIVHELKAFWFLDKPVQAGVLGALLERAVAQKQLIDEATLLNRQLRNQGVLGDLVGGSAEMRQVYSLISQVAPTSAPVLITGESGTGKELVARALHRLSPRAGSPFIAINCAAMPENLMESELFGHEKGAFTGAVERRAGCFEQASGGTVLLDEIGEMPIGTQAKLLRVLEEGKVRRLGGLTEVPVPVRVVAATNRDPEEAIRDKNLREDLYYRLNVFHITLPPLRRRAEDIPAICEAMLSNLNQKHGCRVGNIHPQVLEIFRTAAWPGNVRQLRNVLERAVIVAGEGTILPKHLGDQPNASSGAAFAGEEDGSIRVRFGPQLREVEDAYIDLVLKQTGNNKTKAAKVLGISLRTLHLRRQKSPEMAVPANSGG